MKIYTCIYIYIHTNIFMSIHIYMCVYMYLYMCISIYIYIDIHKYVWYTQHPTKRSIPCCGHWFRVADIDQTIEGPLDKAIALSLHTYIDISTYVCTCKRSLLHGRLAQMYICGGMKQSCICFFLFNGKQSFICMTWLGHVCGMTAILA